MWNKNQSKYFQIKNLEIKLFQILQITLNSAFKYYKNFNFGILKFANFHTYESSEQPLVFIQLLFIFLLTIVVFN